jgi:hypothetical protein
LLETLQLNCGVIHGQGTLKDGNTVDGAALEARASAMSTKFQSETAKNGRRKGISASSQVD